MPSSLGVVRMGIFLSVCQYFVKLWMNTKNLLRKGCKEQNQAFFVVEVTFLEDSQLISLHSLCSLSDVVHFLV